MQCRYAGRFDCGCVYEFHFSLLDEKKLELEGFRDRKKVAQGQGSEWHKVEALFYIALYTVFTH